MFVGKINGKSNRFFFSNMIGISTPIQVRQPAISIVYVHGSNTTYDRIMRRWFERSRSGIFDLWDKPHGQPKTKVNNDELKAILDTAE